MIYCFTGILPRDVSQSRGGGLSDTGGFSAMPCTSKCEGGC
jgi:hypothetical protein